MSDIANQPQDCDTLTIISFIIGIISLIITIAALVYAYIAASKSEKLLKRLVVYPYRELDKNIQGLMLIDKERLFELFEKFGRNSFTEEEVKKIFPLHILEISLKTLVENRWLIKKDRIYTINGDRIPYLNFYMESIKNGNE